jgi:hypothetical protein
VCSVLAFCFTLFSLHEFCCAIDSSTHWYSNFFHSFGVATKVKGDLVLVAVFNADAIPISFSTSRKFWSSHTYLLSLSLSHSPCLCIVVLQFHLSKTYLSSIPHVELGQPYYRRWDRYRFGPDPVYNPLSLQILVEALGLPNRDVPWK